MNNCIQLQCIIIIIITLSQAIKGDSKLLKADIPRRFLSAPIFYPAFDVNLYAFFQNTLAFFSSPQ